MTSRGAAIAMVVSVAAAACDGGGGSEAPGRTEAPSTAPAPVTAAPAEPDQPDAPVLEQNGRVVEEHGVTVQLEEAGTVHLTATDRWGRPVDTRYEDLGYLRRALPALERELGEEQSAVVRDAVERLDPAGSAAAANDSPRGGP